jgi:hypothetical protein
MDLSKFKTSDWLKIGGAIGFLIFGFFDWAKASVAGFSASGGNVFDFFFTGTIPWLLVIATGVLTFLLAAQLMKPGNVPWTLIFLAATALAALLIVIRLIIGPADDVPDGIDVSRGIGLWLSTISVLVALAGAILGFRESGGEFSDLTDMNKLRGAFNTGGTTADAPPPPPAPPTAPPAPPTAPPTASPAPPPAPPTAGDVPPTGSDVPPPPPPPPSA